MAKQKTEKSEQQPQPEATPATAELFGFGIHNLGSERWEAYRITTKGRMTVLGKKPESKARALARLIDAIHEAYLNRHAAKRRAAAA